MDFKHKITVFTPTYNRAYIIHNLYHSLKRQTCKDFEWLVIDDGSTDDTESLFDAWKSEDNDFSIRYYKQENGGKHKATNYASSLANGFMIFVVDSDDYLTDDAIEKIIWYENQIVDKEKYAGLFLASDSIKSFDNNQHLNDKKNIKMLDATFYEKNKYKVTSGEKADVLYTNVLKRYNYPIFDDERFMSEGVIYNRMAKDNLLIRWIDDVIYLYEYLPNGLTSNAQDNFVKNPKGYFLFLKGSKKKRSFLDILKFYYSFYCDLQAFYNIKQIASISNTHVISIKILSIIFNIKNKFRR